MHVEPTKLVLITPPRYVLVETAHALTGYTVRAIERKIQSGQWREGEVWRRAPDGRVVIDLDGFARWVQSGNRRPRK